jgi:hypothetical protein
VGAGGVVEAANGFLSAPDPGMLLACLERLAGDSELARTMGECGRQFALEMHSADRLRDEIENLYFDLAAKSSSLRLRSLASSSRRDPLSIEPPPKSNPAPMSGVPVRQF